MITSYVSDLTVVPPTGFKVVGQDLATRYRPKFGNTASVTGFRISNNMDLSTLFEFGDYTPSFTNVTLSATGRTARINVS
jgi:hypothetical protein